MLKNLLLIVLSFSTFCLADSAADKGVIDQIIEETTNGAHTPYMENIQNSSTNDEGQDYGILLKKTGFLLLGLIIVVLATIYLLKRFATNRNLTTNRVSYIKVIERRSISPKTTLYLVELGNRKILFSESQFELRSHGDAIDMPNEGSIQV